ncbi:MAG: hypothetical protein NUV74_09610 [Candidatus Brocadiaceae bacterium]|nr:hypothetical protein [Candidatus Brocadiaceae bacterium]
MVITKRQVLDLVKDLPDEIDIDELMYRLYLRQKLEVAEKDYGKIYLFLMRKVKETSEWFKKQNGRRKRTDNYNVCSAWRAVA